MSFVGGPVSVYIVYQFPPKLFVFKRFIIINGIILSVYYNCQINKISKTNIK